MWRDEKIGSYRESRDFTNVFEPRAEGEHERSKNREDYLRRRQKIAELVKSKQKKNEPRPDPSPSSSSRAEPRKALPYDKSFGSFFGPSQPIVTKRVLEEGRSREEARRAAMAKQTTSQVKPVMKQVSSSSKTVVKTQQKPVNKTKSKVQTLKEARDYKFLFSEGGDEGEKPAKSSSTPRASSSKLQDTRRPGPSSNSNSNSVSRQRPGETSKRPASSVASRPTGSTLRNQPLKIASAPRNSLSSAPASKPGTGSNSRVKPPELPGRKPPVNVNSRPVATPSKAPASTLKPPVKKPPVAAETRGKSSEPLRRPANASSRPAPPPKQKPPPQKPLPQKRQRRDEYDDDDDDGDYEDFRKYLPAQFRLRRGNYDAEESDISDMETPFDQMQREEFMSEQIAREEDRREEELLAKEQREREERRKRRRK